MEKPERIFDRDFEWRQLAAFASRATDRPQLGVVSGRRRQGKTYLLEALAKATGGMYFGATEAVEAESLRLFASAVAGHLGKPVVPRFEGWDEAIVYLFNEASGRPGPIVIDEFPYLSKISPALPSILQREIDRGVSAGTPMSLLLCGSAMSVMGGLLSGSAPLRGRAVLELLVRPFEYGLAATFWGIRDPRLAVLTHSIVGGTPAYRQFVGGDAPADLGEFDDWVLRTVLNPATPLFREARYLMEEEAEVRDSAIYHSVLAAVAAGNNTRGGIARYIGRKSADIGHHLNVLEDACLLRREADLFRSGNSTYRIAEPLITFYHAIMRPRWGLLESGRSAMVWEDAAPRFHDQVVGPHIEELCRQHALAAPSGFFAELPGEIGSGVVNDSARRGQIQIDVAVLAPAEPHGPRRVLALGEAKWGEKMGVAHVERLRRARDLLADRGYDTDGTALVCYAGAEVETNLAAAFPRDRVITVTLEDLYG